MTIQITSFDWDEHNLDHIENHPDHPIGSDSVEEVLLSRKRKIRRTWQDRYIAYGQSMEGQYLTVVFENKGRGVIRPVSARPMAHHERKLYGRK